MRGSGYTSGVAMAFRRQIRRRPAGRERPRRLASYIRLPLEPGRSSSGLVVREQSGAVHRRWVLLALSLARVLPLLP